MAYANTLASAALAAMLLAESAAANETWIYLGRRSADTWRPAAGAIAPPAYPLKAGDSVVVRSDALVYGPVDCKRTAAADFQAGSGKGIAHYVKPDAAGLEVVGAPIECDSAGHAKTVWVQVRIPAERLVSVER